MNAVNVVTERSSILITGAAGYIGSRFTRALAADRGGYTTIVAADVKPLPALDGVVCERLDVRDRDAVHALMARHRVDTVVHLAAIVSPGGPEAEALEHAVDVGGTRNVLDAAIACGARRLVVTSSGAAYGYHADSAPMLDEDAPLRGNDAFPYARHKRLVEQMLAAARASHPALEQVVFRPGTVLGATTKNTITALFERQVIVGLEGSASPFVFIHDDDVVQCLLRAARGEQTGVFNLAGDGVMTLREIAARLGKPYVEVPPALIGRGLDLLRRYGKTTLGPEHVDFLRYRPVLSNARLKSAFGYVPRLNTRQVFELYAEAHGHKGWVAPSLTGADRLTARAWDAVRALRGLAARG